MLVIIHKVLPDNEGLPFSREDIRLFNVKLYYPKYVLSAFADSQIYESVTVSETASTGGIGLEFCLICFRIFHGGHWSDLSKC